MKTSAFLFLYFIIAILIGVIVFSSWDDAEIMAENISPKNAVLFNQDNISIIPDEKLERVYAYQIQIITVEFDAKEYLAKHTNDVVLKQIYNAGINSPPTYIVEIFTDSLTVDIPGYE